MKFRLILLLTGPDNPCARSGNYSPTFLALK